MERVAMPWASLPRYLVLDPSSTVRFDLRLARAACEVDIELQNPRPGRAFLLLVGPHGGPQVQRMRLSGRARILFDTKGDRSPVLMLANPEKEPLVLQLRSRARPSGGHRPRGGRRRATAARAPPSRVRHRTSPRERAPEPPGAAPNPPASVAPVGWVPRRARPKG